ISISATVDPARAAGLPLRAGFVSGKEGFEVALSAQGAPLVRAARIPAADFVLEGSGNALAAAIYGPGPQALAAAGLVGLRGDRAAAQKFSALFRLAPQAMSSSDSPDETVQALGASST